MSDSHVRWLDSEQQKIWRTYLRATAHVNQALDADLRQQGLDMAEYNILVCLSEAADQKMRMSQLADEVVHSRSRLTHTVTRLEKRGLVARETCQDDGRGILARLTPAGLTKIEEVAPVHLAAVRGVLVDSMSGEDFRALGRAMSSVLSVAD